MSGADYLELGDWNSVCFTCGFKYKASQMKKNWQGFWECQSCWTPRQPQDFVRALPDVQTPPWVQPRPAITYAQTDYIVTEAYDSTAGNPFTFYLETETSYPLETET